MIERITEGVILQNACIHAISGNYIFASSQWYFRTINIFAHLVIYFILLLHLFSLLTSYFLVTVGNV